MMEYNPIIIVVPKVRNLRSIWFKSSDLESELTEREASKPQTEAKDHPS